MNSDDAEIAIWNKSGKWCTKDMMKELFKKKLNGERLTKTEKEYYSRTVKKKVSALANPELHRFAQKLMDY